MRLLALALALALPLALATLGGLTACSSVGGTSRCLDYISLDTPQQRFDAASVVVVAEVRPTGRTIRAFADYPIFRATVVEVAKGSAPHAFDVVAPSDQCEQQGRAAEYLDGDPLDGFHRGVLYLTKSAGVWQLVTPAALDPLDPGAPLPFASPSPSPSPTPSPGETRR